MPTATTAPRFRIYSLMDDEQLVLAVHDLERSCSQPGMRNAPERTREDYEAALDAAREELERRSA